MNYLKEKLEEGTSHKLELQSFLDFLKLVPVQPSQNERLIEFLEKWSGTMYLSKDGLILCYVRGCWMPKVYGSADLQRQTPWETFVRSYSEDFTRCTTDAEGSSAFHPLNFDDLLRLTLWEEMYSIYGSGVMNFIFGKCLLIIPIEEYFYLSVAHPASLLCKKIVTSSYYPVKKQRRLRSFIEIRSNTAEYHLQGIAVVPPKPVKSSFNKGDGRVENPYDSSLATTNHVNEIVGMKAVTSRSTLENGIIQRTASVSRRSRKLKRKLELEKQPPCGKKSKAEGLILLEVERPSTSAKARAPPSSTNPRWVIPSTDILKQIQSDRASQKVGKNNSGQLNDESTPTFVSILNDKYFKKQLYLITKERHTVIFGQPMNSRLHGLKIPVIFSGPDGVSLDLIVHRISETAARKYGIRIIPRGRHRRNKNEQQKVNLVVKGSIMSANTYQTVQKSLEAASAVEGRNSSEMPCTSKDALKQLATTQLATEALNRALMKPTLGSARVHPSKETVSTVLTHLKPGPSILAANMEQNQATRENTPTSKMTWSPYNPQITLSTLSIVHNKSSDCYAPTKSHLGRLQALLTPTNLKNGRKALELVILDYSVHQLPNTADNTNPHLREQIECLQRENKNGPMLRILDKIVRFHNRARNITKLVKSCASHWILKEHYSSVKKAQGKSNRKEKRTAPVVPEVVNSLNVLPNETGRMIDLVDLTIDTPTIPSTNISGESPQASKTNSCIINADVSRERNTPESHLQRQLEASLLFNLSVTVNPESQSLIQKRKQVILSRKLKETVQPACILSTLSQILHVSGASEFLGSNYNRRWFFRFLRKSIFLGGLRSALHLGELLSSLNPDHCAWLKDIEDPAMRTHLFTKVIAWLFTEYVLVMLGVGFYVTESSSSRSQVQFYFRDNWKSLSDRMRDRFVKQGKLIEVPQNENVRPTGSLRLIPKTNDLRPVLSLKKETKPKESDLECMKILLDYITVNIAPHGIRDESDLRKQWKGFIAEWKNMKCPKLFYVRADIKDAYPSVNTETLQKIIKDALRDEKGFAIKRFLRVGAAKHQRALVRLSDKGARSNWHASMTSRPCIVQDLHEEAKFDLVDVVQKLLQILKSKAVVSIGKRKYNFSHGLPQGFALSYALCNIYYGHMDELHFADYFNVKGDLFFRSVDDYFYISPSPHRAAAVFHKLRKGFTDYQCQINKSKSVSNLYVQSNRSVENSEWVGFCGWRFSLTNGHVVRDFSSYADQDMCSALTFRLHGFNDAESFIHRRLGIITPLRLKPLVLDPAINCRHRILMTLFEGALMMAFRFYAACRVVYLKLGAIQDKVRSFKLFKAISRFATSLNRYMIRIGMYLYPSKCCCCCLPPCSKLKKISEVNTELDLSSNETSEVEGPITSKEVFFIVYHAFCIKLSQHSGVFQKDLLPKLVRLKRKVENGLDVAFLLQVLGTELPDHFKAIKI